MTTPDLDLAALLVSRVCHDLISPVGAISNGMEILEDEQDQEMRKHALALIEHSVAQARSRLLFARLAFGAMGSAGAEIPLREAGNVASEFFRGGKPKFIWESPEAVLDKELVKIALNLAQIGADCIPRGGSLTCKVNTSADGTKIDVLAEGPRANLAQDIVAALSGALDMGDLTGRTIAPHMIALLARRLSGRIVHTASAERVALTANFPAKLKAG
jgi:histidine phosphotransferase ChpT